MTDTAPAAPAPDATPATPAPAAPPAGEEAELLALHARDPQVFEYSPWGDTGRTGAERLFDLRKAQEAHNKTDEPQPDPSGDDLAAEDDVDDIDLDAPADGTEENADEAAETAEADAETAEASDLPYDLPEVQGFEWSDADRSAISTRWPELSELADEERNALLSRYAGLRVQMESNDKAETKAATEALAKAWGGRKALKDNIREIKTFLGDETRVSPALAARIAEARSASGGRLVNDPEFAQLLLKMARGQTGGQQEGDRSALLQQELAEIDTMMRSDIGAYHQKGWRGSDKSAGDRRLEIMRQLDSPDPNPRQTKADLEAEKRELVRLRERDPELYRFGNWRGTGRPASDRLVAIQSGRA